MIEPRLAPAGGARLSPRNRLLAALPFRVLLSLESSLKPVSLPRGRVLCEADEPLRWVYFVEAGAVSLVSIFEDGSTAEMATLGREGVLGISVFLGGELALGRYVVSVPGLALALEASQFRKVMRQNPEFCRGCEVYAQAFVADLLQNVACNAVHRVEQRCARWLLMWGDHTGEDTFEITQEYLADLLGVRPSTVTIVAGALQDAGLIRYRRGAITLLDRQKLEAAACECYRIVRDRYEQRSGPMVDRSGLDATQAGWGVNGSPPPCRPACR
jgi:CRP-like cAMP-binding protein